MNKTLLIVIGVVVVLGLSIISPRNTMVRYENQVEAVDLDMQNVHASIFQQMKQQGVSVEKYGSMVTDALAATFGDGGSKAAFQFLQNQGTIPPSVMNKLQVTIEAGYNKFEATQRTKIDTVRVYKNYAEQFPVNIVAGLFGYPSKSWAKLGKIVTSAQTKADFSSGELSDPGIFK